MLGSAIVILDIEDRDTPTMCGWSSAATSAARAADPARPRSVDRADVLIMESTYGDRLHPPPEDAVKKLERIIAEALQRGGAQIIIPAFAVGRTQQIVYSLHQLDDTGDIPQLPVYVDSPLAINATDIFRMHPECYDDENPRVHGRRATCATRSASSS